MESKNHTHVSDGEGGMIPVVTISVRERRAVKACNKLYNEIHEALEAEIITGLQFKVARCALVLIESLIVKRFSFDTYESAWEQLQSAVDIQESFDEFSE